MLKDFNFGTRLHKFEFFPCTGTETMHIGLHDVHKSYIGLPFYFEYKELEDIDEDEFVFISEQAPNWEREDGKQFLENLVLSENAKKYAIAESIALAYSYENLLRCTYPIFSIIYSTFSFLRMDTILQEKWKVSAAIRRFCSTLFGASILLSWLLLFKLGVDEYTKGVINDFINELATKQDYIDGGIEYHSKNHKRAILLRESNDGLIAFFNMKYTHSQMIENLSKWAR